jgi:nucleoside-diphosphate kinase
MKSLSDIERTLIIVKPDGVRRGLVGIVLSRVEHCQLRIVHLRMLCPSEGMVLEHYGDDPSWLNNAGGRAIRVLAEAGCDPAELAGSDDPIKVGLLIRSRLASYMSSGPVVVAVAEGPKAVEKVRRLVGATLPLEAEPASVRGMFCTDSVLRSFREGRALENVVHASGSVGETSREMEIWLNGDTSYASDADAKPNLITTW